MRRRVVKHGTLTQYSTYKCRCNACVDAKSLANEEYRLRQRLKVTPAELWRELPAFAKSLKTKQGRPIVNTPHGTHSRYIKGCRCGPCTWAATEYARRRDLVKRLLPFFKQQADPRVFLVSFSTEDLFDMVDEFIPKRLGFSGEEVSCGQAITYIRFDCRCDPCKKAFNVSVRERKRISSQRRRDKERENRDKLSAAGQKWLAETRARLDAVE